jgi:spermidine/putrescine transport system permease protein
MATVTETRPAAPARPAPRPPRKGPLRWVREHIVQIVAFFVFVYMLLPNLLVVVFSFNQPKGKYNYEWEHFSLNAWLHPCAPPGMCSAVKLSLEIGILATILATVLGTLMAFALARYRFAGRAATNLLIFMPMATPEVVMGSSLLTLFVAMSNIISLGATTIFIAHVMFCVSFVVVTVKARIAGLDPRLEQAAMDLYATERQTFMRITLPLVAPGIAAGALLAFSLSFDDFIITNFNSSATSQTFPLFVWGAAQKGTPPQMNVVGTAMFLVSFIIVGIAQLIAWRRRKAKA